MLDFLVVGGGIAGAAVAQALALEGSTLLAERETQPGYHSTGRSAAVFAGSYGPPPVRALTRASRSFFTQPPTGFAPSALLQPRGALFVADPGQGPALQALHDTLGGESPRIQRLSSAAILERLPVLRPERVAGAVWDPDVFDIDVHALHQGFLRSLLLAGGQVRCGAEVRALARADDHWKVDLGAEHLSTRVVVNAAGAWCDDVAARAGLAPLGIKPLRRSAFVFAGPADRHHGAWPMAVGVDEDWYLKPDAGQWLGSPANADLTPPQDVQPEQLDIALGMHRIGEMTTLDIGRPRRCWAGLRSFFADGVPAAGFDPRVPGFFWLAGQGGYGIQTAPALGQLAAALACGRQVPAALGDHGVQEQAFAVDRLLVRASAP